MAIVQEKNIITRSAGRNTSARSQWPGWNSHQNQNQSKTSKKQTEQNKQTKNHFFPLVLPCFGRELVGRPPDPLALSESASLTQAYPFQSCVSLPYPTAERIQKTVLDMYPTPRKPKQKSLAPQVWEEPLRSL